MDLLRVAIKRGLCHSSYIFYTHHHHHHHHHLIVIIIACNPAWDIGRQSASSSRHGPAGPDVLTLPMCSQSSLSLPLGVCWLASLPFLLRFPGDGLPCDVGCRLTEDVTNPSPASLKDVVVATVLGCCCLPANLENL